MRGGSRVRETLDRPRQCPCCGQEGATEVMFRVGVFFFFFFFFTCEKFLVFCGL